MFTLDWLSRLLARWVPAKRWLAMVGGLCVVAAIGVMLTNNPRFGRWLLLVLAASGWCFYGWAAIDVLAGKANTRHSGTWLQRFLVAVRLRVWMVCFLLAFTVLARLTVKGAVTALSY